MTELLTDDDFPEVRQKPEPHLYAIRDAASKMQNLVNELLTSTMKEKEVS
jgi:hypothetical protein